MENDPRKIGALTAKWFYAPQATNSFCGLIGYQISKDLYLATLYDLKKDEEIAQKIVSMDSMNNWFFYNTLKEMKKQLGIKTMVERIREFNLKKKGAG